MGWKINLWARFLDGDHAYKILQNLITPASDVRPTKAGLFVNMFDAHPPFQIDGNFAFTAGVSEMLLQSHLDGLDLLPALPAAWPNGSVKGLRARGGYEIDLAWAGGKLTAATVRNVTATGPVQVRCGSQTIALTLKPGEARTLSANLN
jgi:alpha-L-fucosidase 2